jgi:predicted TIM-barrel fold metal-dependent hydrolase
MPIAAPERYCTKTYDKVWAAAQANGMVMVIHIGAGDPNLARLTSAMTRSEYAAAMDPTDQATLHANRMRDSSMAHLSAQTMIAELVGGGVLDRFPELHFMATEFNAGWLAGFMGAIDKAYTLGIGQEVSSDVAAFGIFDHSREADDQPLMTLEYALNDKWPYALRPSEYIKRQIHLTFQDDPMAIALRGITGVECLLWGSDYPHHEATWPRSRDAMDALFAGVSDQDREAITGGTMAKLFGF